jgi:endonuclease IV
MLLYINNINITCCLDSLHAHVCLYDLLPSKEFVAVIPRHHTYLNCTPRTVDLQPHS